MANIKTMLGIDLRVNSVKFVEIEFRPDGEVIKNWGLIEVPYELVDKHPEKEEAQADALRKLLQTRQIKTTDAAVVLGGSDVFIKLFTLAAVPKDELLESIKWKFSEEINFPPEDALIDYYLLPRSLNAPSEKKEYLAACVNRRVYDDLERILRQAGLNLAAVTILPDALQKVFAPAIKKEPEKIITLMYMGKRTTNISILKDGNLEFNRELSIGGENITLAMSGVLPSEKGEIAISPEQAEQFKLEHGIPVSTGNYPEMGAAAGAQLQAMVRPALERVEGEITRTFEYYKGQTGEAAISKILLTGGSSLTINLAQSLSEGLGLPVEVPDHLQQQVIDENLPDRPALEKVLPRLSTALGAALVGITRINLMPEEKKNPGEILRRRFFQPQYLALAGVALLILIYALFGVRGYWLQNQIAAMQNKLKQYEPRIANLELLEKSTQEEQRRKLLIESYSQKRLSMPELFREISRLTPPSAFINVLNLTPEELHLNGTVFEDRDTAEDILSQFVLALSASRYFQEVKLVQAAQNKGYRQKSLDFELAAQIKIGEKNNNK
ncbi:pilus assembly protein PilM [Candidatus Saganbacteria bacterium]|nr:pilus assembly protein PilM [Candidatus Saganbacteria bacterium]